MERNQIEKNKRCNSFIDGERIYLRIINLSDANKKYCRWLNDREINQYLESRFEKWSLKKLKDYIRKTKEDKDYIFLAIVTKDTNIHIGNIKLGPINRHHKFADMGIIVGDKAFWGKGVATEAIELMVSYAFNTLKLHKLTAGAYANNVGSIKAFKKAGFKIEGLRKKHFRDKNDYVDAVLLGKIKP